MQAHGVWLGILLCTFLVFAGGVVGSTTNFLIGRYLAFETVQFWMQRHRVMRAMDRALAAHGAKMVFLLRLSPPVPFGPCSYLCGVTSVKIADFVAGSVGMLPWVVTCSYIGSALKGVSDVAGAAHGSKAGKHRALSYAIYALGAAATVSVVVLIGRYTKRALEETMHDEEEAAAGGGGTRTEGEEGLDLSDGSSGNGYTEMGAVGDVGGGGGLGGGFGGGGGGGKPPRVPVRLGGQSGESIGGSSGGVDVV